MKSKLVTSYKDLKYYIISIVTFILQLLFISVSKEFKNEFIVYIQILSLSSLVVGLLGSIQFYIDLKKKKKLIFININSIIIKILLIFFVVVSCYYFMKEPILSVLFSTTFISLIVILLKSAIFARKGEIIKNSYLFLINNIIKIFFIFLAYLNNFNFYYTIIISNLIVIITCVDIFLFIKLNNHNKKKFSLLSGLNTFMGGSITTLDKVYASKYLIEFVSNYYIIFRIASIFQTITEVIFRKERFDITSKKINKLYFNDISIKVYLCFFLLISTFLLISNIETAFLILNIFEIKHLMSFFQILENYNFEFFLIGLSFILNSIASLKYDLIYAIYGKSFLILCNLLNLIIFIFLLIFFAKSLETLCYIFLVVQVTNFIIIEIIYKKYV